MSLEETQDSTPFRPCWTNCGIPADEEMRAIDAMEDALKPSLSPGAARIRANISTLEMCHHKAERWVENIVTAIGQGDSDKGLGTRGADARHPAEDHWQCVVDVLQGWIEGKSPEDSRTPAADVSSEHWWALLGEPTPLKEWQIRRVAARIEDLVGFRLNPATPGYVMLLDWSVEPRADQPPICPEPYRSDYEFWRQTVETVIRDTEWGARHSLYGDTPYGESSELNLAMAIDMLWPCNWNFLDNLELVLGVVGGNTHPTRAFAFCARNIKLSPIRERAGDFCAALAAFCAEAMQNGADHTQDLRLLGQATPEKIWLARSLEKTIRIQLDL